MSIDFVPVDDDRYAVGDRVVTQITGCVGDYRAEVLEVDQNGWPTSLRVLDDATWPTLKAGDFILWGREAT